jgi:hypothetical protein
MWAEFLEPEAGLEAPRDLPDTGHADAVFWTLFNPLELLLL